MDTSKNTPPLWPLRFLRWIIRPEYLEEIEGDMEEVFQDLLDQYSTPKARRKFALEALKLFRLSLLKPFLPAYLTLPTAMLKHNFLITYRSYLRNKSSFLINLLGLSSGLACALLIYLWVADEVSVDKFHEHDAQLYQVMRKIQRPDELTLGVSAPGPLAEMVRAEVPEVEAVSSYNTHKVHNGVIIYEDKHVRATPMFADNDFLHVFTFPLVYGDKKQVLADKYAAVVSEEIALKLFNSTEAAIGKTISWEKKVGDFYHMNQLLTITGVFENVPGNSTEDFDVIMNLDFYIEYNPGVKLWTNDQAIAAIVVHKGTDIASLTKKITELVNQKTGDNYVREFVLIPYSSKYLYNKYENGAQAGGRITYVWLFSAIAILILIIAGINFMNLSTAKASVRVKEIGVKKTLGATRRSLIFQFVSESLLISLVALFISLIFVTTILPWFNEITGKQLSTNFSWNLFAAFLGITLITGLFSSTYPALYLSGFKAVEVLKGKLNITWGEVWTRKGLVVFQFAISVVLIVSVLIIYRQMSYIQNKNLGFDKDHILKFEQEGKLDDHVESFLAEVRKLPTVIQAANSNHELVGAENWTTGIDWEGRKEDEFLIINPIISNFYFIETFDIKIKEGRSFSPEFGADSSKVILNEAAAKSMGLENPIGKTITFWRDQVEIIGIAEDFHFQSLYKNVMPCIIKKFGKRDYYGSHIWVKMKAGQEAEAIAGIEKLYKEFNPGYDFKYGFVDEDYQALYESETRVAALSRYFAGLAILISCLGLFGLAAFTAERRTKEIGIRKILGASVWNIVRLLSTDFTKMVVIAILIAMPVSYLIASNWLDSFAYKIDLQWWYFVGASVLTLFIAWLTVSVQTLKTAHINPVECLRDE